MKAVVLVALLVLISGTAGADIVEWEDAEGVRHYTNVAGQVPQEIKGATRIVVDEAQRARREETPSAPAHFPSAEPVEQRQAEVVYDWSHVSHAYAEGYARGLSASPATPAVTGGSVQINGPLAVAEAPHAPCYPYGYPLHYPFVTTSFDRGRSRHLTLRLLLQDQFAIDREGPYVFAQRPPFRHPRHSLNLSPFLPRGLPHGLAQGARVIVR